jgi:hypothetical protein
MTKRITLPGKSELLANLKWHKLWQVDTNFEATVLSQISLLHVTTADRAMRILESWMLLPLARLKKEGVVYDREWINTDKLDEKLWLDHYVFTTLWRNAFHNWWTISLAFRPTKILRQPWVLASLKEVGDYGALVSPEAEEVYRRATWKDPWLVNRIAVQRFLGWLVRGEDFSRVFAWFLQKNFSKYLDYLTTFTYPGEVLSTNEIWSTNIWWWPQVMIPKLVNLDWLTHIFTRTCSEASMVISGLQNTGNNVPVVALEEYLKSQGIDHLPPAQTDNFIRLMNVLVDATINKDL